MELQYLRSATKVLDAYIIDLQEKAWTLSRATTLAGSTLYILSHMATGAMRYLGDAWKLVPGFVQTSPHAVFSLPDLTLYLFTVINHNHECNHLSVL